jgi:hypothetical protein
MSSISEEGEQTKESKNNNYLFYRTPDKYLINIGKEHYFIPDNTASNKNWEWLKTFTENVIQDISNRKRNSELNIKKDTDNNGVTIEGNRYLKEINYYINRYIYEQNKTITNQNIDNEKIINKIIYEHLNNILTTSYCSKENLIKFIKKLNDAKKIDSKSIDKFMNRRLIINNKSTYNKYSVTIDSEGNQINNIKILNTLKKLNEELNLFNYNYNNNEKNNFTDINFSKYNYIYSGLDKDIKLYSIDDNKNYKYFLIHSQKQQQQQSQQQSQQQQLQQNNIKVINFTKQSNTDNVNKILINLILSIKNRYNIINNQNILNKKINVYDSYISRGVFFYYKNILDELLKKILARDINDKNNIFIPISISIMIYSIIFREIYNNMTDEQVIDFKELNLNSKHEMTKFATLFYVEMKPFLDQYKASDSTQKVKFFCNINDNFNEKKFQNLNENIIQNIKSKIPLESQKQDERVFSINSSNNANSDKTDSVNYDILSINPSNKDNYSEECEPFELKFNKVFDKTSAQVMAPYMAVSNVINNYEGLMLFTFGYSGVGKSYSIFGTKENPGLLYSIFNSIQNITNVTIKIYEIYGMALNKKENFSENVYQKYIYHEISDDYNIENSYITDEIKDINGIEIQYRDLEGFLLKLNNITKEIENKRGILNGSNVTYSYGLEDNEINIKTIKKTKNNPDSSRSILCYELIINKDEQKIPFVVLDLPGKEIIGTSFGEEGEALLKIESEEKINEEFLKENFYNILNKLDKLTKEESDKLFKDIEQNKDENTIKVSYNILSDNVISESNRFNLGFRVKNYNLKSKKTNIEINNIVIDSTNNDIDIKFKDGIKKVGLEELVKNYISNNTNLLILKQKHYAISDILKIDNKIILPLPDNGKNSIYNNNNLYLGFEKGSLFIEVTKNKYDTYKNDNKFRITLNYSDDLQPYSGHNNLESDLENDVFKRDINTALKKNNNEQLNVSYFIIKEDKLEQFKKEYIQNVEESNKESKRANLIRAMKNAIKYTGPQQNEKSTENQKSHPILKLTHILDRINDNEYINNYKYNAEKCFKYTKSAEGIFINENINGIMQLMINKKNLNNDMLPISGDYNESLMFYNEKISNFNFNKTLIYDKFYNNYENNSNLKKIDNMYAFFVVANISNNERIKQKLICNATKDEQGNYKTDLGWDCDEKALEEERKKALEKQKREIEEEREKKIDDINFIVEKLGNRDRLKKDRYLHSDNRNVEYFQIINKKFGTGFEKKELENILKEFKSNNNMNLENKELIKKFAVVLYNKIQTKLAENANNNEKKLATSVISNLKQDQYSQDIIKNFKEINTNNDEKITKIEFGSALKRKLDPNKDISPKALTLIFNEIDLDGNGYITIEEFVANIIKQNEQGGGNYNNDRELYIREMCDTQVALFRELKDTINDIVDPNK